MVNFLTNLNRRVFVIHPIASALEAFDFQCNQNGLNDPKGNKTIICQVQGPSCIAVAILFELFVLFSCVVKWCRIVSF